MCNGDNDYLRSRACLKSRWASLILLGACSIDFLNDHQQGLCSMLCHVLSKGNLRGGMEELQCLEAALDTILNWHGRPGTTKQEFIQKGKEFAHNVPPPPASRSCPCS